MITSDAHEGIQDAISNVFPEVPWQRCQFHFAMNISGKSPKKYRAGIRAELRENVELRYHRSRTEKAGLHHR